MSRLVISRETMLGVFLAIMMSLSLSGLLTCRTWAASFTELESPPGGGFWAARDLSGDGIRFWALVVARPLGQVRSFVGTAAQASFWMCLRVVQHMIFLRMATRLSAMTVRHQASENLSFGLGYRSSLSGGPTWQKHT